MRPYLLSLAHVMYGTVATWLSGMMLRQLFIGFQAAALIPHHFKFEVNSFALAFVPVGLVAGYVSFSRIGGRSAFWVFTVPVAPLAIRVLTFPAGSVFSSGPFDGLNYFFGNAKCAPLSLHQLYLSAPRCLSRMIYLGNCYSAGAYSAGALAKHLRVFEVRREGTNTNVDQGF